MEIAKTLVFPHNFLFSQFPFILIHERGKCFVVLLSNNVYVLEVVLSIVFVRSYLITTLYLSSTLQMMSSVWIMVPSRGVKINPFSRSEYMIKVRLALITTAFDFVEFNFVGH